MKSVLSRNMISLIRVKNQEKVKALLTGVNVGNVKQWTQMLSTWVEANLNSYSNFRTRYKVPRGRSETPATHKMELFVTLVDDWMPQTNATKNFTLDVAMV